MRFRFLKYNTPSSYGIMFLLSHYYYFWHLGNKAKLSHMLVQTRSYIKCPTRSESDPLEMIM